MRPRQQGAEHERAVAGFVELERVETEVGPALPDRLEDLFEGTGPVVLCAIGSGGGIELEVGCDEALESLESLSLNAW